MRVLVVDGHPAMRLGIKGLLNVTGDMWVVGETGEGEDAIRLAEEVGPDLVILGLNLSGAVNGVEVCRRLKALPDPPRVLVHTAYDFTDDVSSCLLAGADGYLHKRADCGALLDAARRTAASERVFSDLSGRIGEPRSAVVTAPRSASLTPKERDVLVLMLCHCSNAEMSEQLYLSCETVRTHVKNVLRKLGLKSRRELFGNHGPKTVEL